LPGFDPKLVKYHVNPLMLAVLAPVSPFEAFMILSCLRYANNLLDVMYGLAKMLKKNLPAGDMEHG
jgi:hypothetical protein